MPLEIRVVKRFTCDVMEIAFRAVCCVSDGADLGSLVIDARHMCRYVLVPSCLGLGGIVVHMARV